MLRIRLPTGNIRELNDSQELAEAIMAGEVGPEAEIFHARSGRWVSVTDHPVFRKLTAAAPPAPPPSNPPPPVPPASPEPPIPALVADAPTAVGSVAVATGSVPSRPADESPTASPASVDPTSGGPATQRGAPISAESAGPPSHGPSSPPRAVPSPEPARRPPPVIEMQTRSGAEIAARRRFAWKMPAMVLVLALVLAVGGLVLSRRGGAAPPDHAIRPTAGVAVKGPVIRQVPRDTSPSVAPGNPQPLAGVPPQTLAEHHAKVADSLDAALGAFTRRIGLIGFLGTQRLASGESLRASRVALGRFSTGLSAYRAQQQTLSRTYNDSADAFVLSGAWDRGALQEWQIRVRRPEPPAVVARADVLVANLDSLLALLIEQQGAYEISPSVIRFHAPRASLRYEDLVRIVNASRVSSSEHVSTPLTVLGQAMAGSQLPPTSIE